MNPETGPSSNPAPRSGGRTGARPSGSQNLEFDFSAAAPAVATVETADTSTPSRKERTPMSTTFEDSKARLKSQMPSSSPDASTTPASAPSAGTTGDNTFTRSSVKSSSTTGASSPTFSQFQQNVQRQAKEQKAVGSILSGLAIALIGSIVMVALLAGFGGYMLYKQIQQQSVTVTQLDTKLSKDINNLHLTIQEADLQIQNLITQTQAQKQQIAWLQGQTEELRNQDRKNYSALAARLQRLENRLGDIEKDQGISR